jgi:hypothetical protein
MTTRKFRIRVERVFEYEVQANDEDHAYDRYVDGDYDEIDEQTMDIQIEEKDE